MLGDGIPEAHKELIRAGWSPPPQLRTPELIRWLIHDRTVVDDNGCWVWQGTLRNGYGYLWGYVSHRIAWEMLIGPIPKGPAP
ncbi:MAG: hypothetical protein M3Q47_09650 [Actinomycetota bacterium]|nr:hypothetical protein [Actinomycetota bacterium]